MILLIGSEIKLRPKIINMITNQPNILKSSMKKYQNNQYFYV